MVINRTIKGDNMRHGVSAVQGRHSQNEKIAAEWEETPMMHNPQLEHSRTQQTPQIHKKCRHSTRSTGK